MRNERLALDAAAATITTATVTIRTLRVGTKQLTQAVFRQLPKRKLIRGWEANCPTIFGVVWGWVNYNPDSSDSGQQFVAQFGEVLCRCPVLMNSFADASEAAAFMPEMYSLNQFNWDQDLIRALRREESDPRNWWKSDIIRQWDRVLKQLNDVPQLFIAV